MSKIAIASAAALFSSQLALAAPSEPFQFEEHPDVSDMQSYVQQNFPLGSSRSDVRRAFVDQGRATLIPRPGVPSTEKYIYEIDFCHYHVWRWNISADYDSFGKVKQIYIEGDPALSNGITPPPKVHRDPGPTASVSKLVRDKPQAYKGDDKIYAVVIDWNTTDPANTDKDVFVGGPTRAEFPNMGTVHVYHGDLWRSIVDPDEVKYVVESKQDCSKFDAPANGERPINVSFIIMNKMLSAGANAIGRPPSR